MVKLFIEKIDRTRTGTNSKTGEVFKKIGVYADSKWYSCGQNAENNTWKEGDTVEVEVKEVKTASGQSFWNIIPTKRNSPAFDELLEITKRIEQKIDLLIEASALDKDEKTPF